MDSKSSPIRDQSAFATSVFEMSQEKQIEALFVLSNSLKSQIKILTDKVEALSAAQISPEKCNCSNDIKEIQEEITDLVDFQIEETAKANKELDLVDKAMDRLFSRTQDLRSNHEKLEDKVKKVLSEPQAHSVSVNRKLPQFSRSKPNQRSRPVQVRQQVRICYNCRKPGHLAANCRKSNPRLKGLSAPLPPKTKLKVQFKSQEPATNSVDVAMEPVVSATFGTVIVPVQDDGSYQPFVYPNGSTNHLMKDYSWAELNRGFTPFNT